LPDLTYPLENTKSLKAFSQFFAAALVDILVATFAAGISRVFNIAVNDGVIDSSRGYSVLGGSTGRAQ